MKRKLQIIISASAASVLAFSALAQDTSNPQTDATQSPRQHMTQNTRIAKRHGQSQRHHWNDRQKLSARKARQGGKTLRWM
jgi:Ni/Co efflux regulator RcnB